MSEREKNSGRPKSGFKRNARTDNDRTRPGKRQRGAKPAGAPRVSAEASSERIAKRLARAGISSRRDAEALVEAGRVSVNGTVLSSPAFNVSPNDRIEIDGTLIPPIERTRLFLFHKPAGVVTTNRDPEGRQTVFDVLPEGLPRLMTIGRLDINTEGLLLLTNDGGLARVLELPSTGWLRRYRVRVHGEIDEEALAGLKDGIAVDGVFYGAIEAALDRKQGSNAWLTIGLREGKNREVKNILGALGLEVTRLIRVSYGPFQLGELAEAEVRELKGRMLKDQLGERLIEEAGANFDAPVTTPFSSKQVEQRAETEERPRLRQPSRGPRVEEGGLIRNRKRERDRKREDALGRLSTKPVRLEKSEKRDEPGGRRRTANVWMAPGARPKKAGQQDEDSASERPKRKAGDFPGKKRGGGFGGAEKPVSRGRERDQRPDDDRRPPRGEKPARSFSKRERPKGETRSSDFSKQKRRPDNVKGGRRDGDFNARKRTDGGKPSKDRPRGPGGPRGSKPGADRQR